MPVWKIRYWDVSTKWAIDAISARILSEKKKTIVRFQTVLFIMILVALLVSVDTISHQRTLAAKFSPVASVTNEEFAMIVKLTSDWEVELVWWKAAANLTFWLAISAVMDMYSQMEDANWKTAVCGITETAMCVIRAS